MRVRSASLMLVALAVAAGTACSPPREEPSTVPANATSAAETTSPAEASETSETSRGQASPSRTEGDHQVIRVDVRNGTVTPPPAPVDVQLGRRVIIEVTSDTDDEIHVHGYELTAPVTAGQPSQVTVDATIPGQFEVELHKAELQLFTLRVQ